jgi:hypothetical protein
LFTAAGQSLLAARIMEESMYGKQKLMVLGPALLALLTLGPVSISHASDTPNPKPPAVVSQSQNGAATGAGASDEQPPWGGYGYWDGYRDGYRAAAQDCRRRQMQSFGGNRRMSEYDRGWIAGYNAGHRRFCTMVE